MVLLSSLLKLNHHNNHQGFLFQPPWIPQQMRQLIQIPVVLPFFKGKGTLSLNFACLVNYALKITHESIHRGNNTGNFCIDTISRCCTKKAVSRVSYCQLLRLITQSGLLDKGELFSD